MKEEPRKVSIKFMYTVILVAILLLEWRGVSNLKELFSGVFIDIIAVAFLSIMFSGLA